MNANNPHMVKGCISGMSFGNQTSTVDKQDVQEPRNLHVWELSEHVVFDYQRITQKA